MPRCVMWVLLVLGLTSPLARAADAEAPLSLIITGTLDSANSTYSYAGYIRPLWGGDLGRGWFSTTMLSYLTYRYNASGAASNFQTTTVHGTGPGAGTGLGYAWRGPAYQVALSAQIGFRQIDLNPVIPSDAPRGTVATAMPQLQARYDLTAEFFADLISNYTFGQHSAYDRLRLGWQPWPSWSGGLEGVDEHGPGYRIVQEGVFLSKQLDGGLSLSIDGGRSRQVGSDDASYVGVSLSKAF